MKQTTLSAVGSVIDNLTNKGWGYCYKADWHNPKRQWFFAEPWGGNDARLKTFETFGCNQYQQKFAQGGQND